MNRGSQSAYETLAEAVDSLEIGGEGHSKAVARWATLIAIERRSPSHLISTIECAGLLHDIGKVELPKELLNKPDRLTPEEFDSVKRHTIIGARIAKALPSASSAADAIEHHHERWDGKGYPHGKRGAEIPIEGRIIAAAEAFASMTRPSPYRPPLTIAQALDRLKWAAHAQLDPQVVEALIKVVERSIPTHMRNEYLTVPLEVFVSSETARLRSAFMGLVQQLMWVVKRLIGELLTQRLAQELSEAFKEDGIPITIEDAQIADETPWVIGLDERAKIYRNAMWHISLALSKVFGDAFISQLLKRLTQTLPDELQETCSRYELHPVLKHAA
ncbi:MAG: HD domain-containing protein [Armatimonadota bacterium]|nr:HD domain-containing protein [Armatimonadota bacterium]MDW8025136.1 HD domain-containing protein [Armatimonadota bacterium]